MKEHNRIRGATRNFSGQGSFFGVRVLQQTFDLQHTNKIWVIKKALTKKETLALVFRKFCKISKNTFSYRIPPVADSAFSIYSFRKLVLIFLCSVFLTCPVSNSVSGKISPEKIRGGGFNIA